MNRSLCSVLACGLFLACNEKAKDPPYFQEGPRQGADASTRLPYLPTNPEGGFVPGKPQELDPEESARRQAKNTSKPIIWGESIAGISLSTSYQEAKKLLAQRLVTDGNFEVYPESIQIAWAQAVPPIPQIIVAFGTYGGKLSLPEPYGQVALGDSFSQHFTDDPGGEQILRRIAAHFEGENLDTYDCRAQLSCGMLRFPGFTLMEFKKGGIAFDANSKLAQVYIVQNQDFVARLTGPYIYGNSISGINLSSTRADVENLIGSPRDSNPSAGLLYYDELNLMIAWGQNQTPNLIGIQGDFLGDIQIPGIGNVKIGDSFAALPASPNTPLNPDELILELDRAFRGDQAYDCLDEETCQIQVAPGSLALHLQEGSFIFRNNAERRLQIVTMVEPQGSFAED